MESVMLSTLVFLAAAPALHIGFHDPEREGWLSTTSNPGVSFGPGTETTFSGVHHYWRLHDETSSSSAVYYVEPGADAFAGDWRLAVSARIVDSPVVPGYPDVPGTGLIVRDGQNYWSFYVANEWVGPMGSAPALARKHWMDTRDDYHCYVIERSPATDTADFYVDGELVFANVPRTGLYQAPEQLVSFGPVSTNGTSNAHYEYVRFRWDADGDLGGPDEHHGCPGNSPPQQQSPGSDSVFAGSAPPEVATTSASNDVFVAAEISESPAGCSVASTRARPLTALGALALLIATLRARRR